LNQPLAISQVLSVVPLLLAQSLLVTLHLVLCLRAVRFGHVRALPGVLLDFLLGFERLPFPLLSRPERLSFRPEIVMALSRGGAG
jgi:hypothetical protein